jgi:hypothetical protein
MRCRRPVTRSEWVARESNLNLRIRRPKGSSVVGGSTPLWSTNPDTARTSWTSGYGSCRDGRGRRDTRVPTLPTLRHLLPAPLRDGIASSASTRVCIGKELLLKGASHPGLVAVR